MRDFASALAADPWSAQAACRLEKLYAGHPSALAVAARTLRTALTINHLRGTSGTAALFVFVPCTSYDECLAFVSLPQVIDTWGRDVFAVVVLPDAPAQEVAIQRAARDNLSRLMYFLDARTLHADRLLDGALRRGSVLVLRCAAALASQPLGSLVRELAGRRGLARCVTESSAGGSIETMADASVDAAVEPEAGGSAFRVQQASTGDLVAVSHGWLETQQTMHRVDPILTSGLQAARRVWFDLGSTRPLGTFSAAEPGVDGDLDATRITCFANHASPGNELVHGFALGHGCRLAYAEDQPADDTPGTSLVWGVLRGSDQVVAAAVAGGRSFIYCDHAYFNRGHMRNYRIILNAHATTRLRRCPDDRVAALGVVLQPWRRQGRHVLVCPPTDFFLRAHGCPNWLANTVSTLHRFSDRPIVVRDKPKGEAGERSLADDLVDCHALVTHSSNAAVEAAVMGVPVFVAPTCAAIGVGLDDLACIESPVTPDRGQWLANLAYAQFTVDEILQGRVLGLMADYWTMEPCA